MADITTNFREEKGQPFNIRLFLLQYLRYWYWFVLSIALTFGAAFLYLRYATPVYLINAALLIRDHPRSTSDKILEKGANDTRAGGGQIMENEIELLKSRSLMLRVVDGLNLAVRYYKEGKVGRDEELYDASPIWINTGKLTADAYKNPLYVNVLNKQQYELQDEDGNGKGRHNFNQDVKNEIGTFRVVLRDSIYQKSSDPIKVSFHDRERTAQEYQFALKIASSLQSSVLKLYIEDAIPYRGKAILNKLLDIYTQTALADKNLEAKYTLQFIDERLRLITGELGAVESNFESYKNSQGITDLSREGVMFLDATSSNDIKLNQIELELKLLDGVENYMKNSQSGFAPASLTDPILKDLLQKLSTSNAQYEKYSRTMQADNPFLQTIADQIKSTKVAIQENIANQRENLKLSLASLQRLNKRFDSSIRSIPRKEREFITIKRQQGIKESLYLLLLQRKEEAAISYASAVTDSRIIDNATSTDYPLKPSRANAYMVALLIGLIIPIGGVTAKMKLSDKIQNRSEIENETGLVVFGEIMRKPKELIDNVIDIKNNRIIAEQFKVLRANLPYADGTIASNKGQLILVTSSIVGEGKSFFSINMASSLAQLDKRVIILELDLRKPKTTSYLGMSDGEVMGISNYLRGQNDMNDLIRQTDLHPNLYLIPAGPIPSNPSELLSNGRIGVLLNELRQQFDYIILDTPPVAYVADTIILGPYVDKAFYIVRHEYTPRNCMQLLTNLAASQKFKSLEVIFNGVSYEKSQEFGYGYGYWDKQTV